MPELEHVLVRDSDYEAWLTGQSEMDPDPRKSQGVAHTHHAWLAAGHDWFYHCAPVEPGDSCRHLSPINHCPGYLATPIWLGGGRNSVVEKFDAASLLDLMERERADCMFVVPTILNAIHRIPGIAKRKLPT